MDRTPAKEPAAAPPSPDDLTRWYGRWESPDPAGVAELMRGFDRSWWIIGGWSIEAFTGVPRAHDDLDISMFARDAPAFREFLGDRWTPWNVDDGWFRPFDARHPDVAPTSQLWLRRDAGSPWVLDIPLTPDTDGRWTSKRCPAHTEDLEDVTWVAPDGLRYARPEVTLMFKAAQTREKDRRDARVCLPMLDARARAWLGDAVERFAPGHPWSRPVESRDPQA